MAFLFYLLLVWLGHIHFSWIWLIVSLFFSAEDTKTVYKYTTNNELDGKEVNN